MTIVQGTRWLRLYGLELTSVSGQIADSGREQQSLSGEQYRRRLDVTLPMIGPQATESLITTEGVTSLSLLQTDLHPQVKICSDPPASS